MNRQKLIINKEIYILKQSEEVCTIATSNMTAYLIKKMVIYENSQVAGDPLSN